MKHLLKIADLQRTDLDEILQRAKDLKRERGRHRDQPLSGQTWALIFSKSSTRTRVSFEVGIRELGGKVIFLTAKDIQLGRGEPIRDTARVLGRMVHGAVIRTYAQHDIEEFAEYSKIPTINALTDGEHPCQIVADIQTFQELRGPIQGKTVAFIGDGACNVPTSWIHAAKLLDFQFRIAAPKSFQPDPDIVAASNGKVHWTKDPVEAAQGADILYTDVWISMGKEDETAERTQLLTGYQINEALVKRAKPDALVMHCLPAYRGKEIDEATLEAHAETIFTQAENRLHAQKGILSWMLAGNQG